MTAPVLSSEQVRKIQACAPIAVPDEVLPDFNAVCDSHEALRARLAALEPVARQLYNAGSETLGAIETVVGCEVGTLNENDLCAKPLLKALDAYRAVDALRAGEGTT